MNLNEVVQKILAKPYTLRMGANKVAKQFKTTPELVKRAKKQVKEALREKHGAKILVLDIETAPLQVYVWRVWKENVGVDQIESEWFMLTWSAKWLFEDTILSDKLTSREAKKEDDRRIVKSVWKLLDEADIVIMHNGDSFDRPKMNTRFIVHGFKPTTLYQTIDTKKIAAKQFGFTHNSLNGLSKLFGFGEKIHTEFYLWKRCVAGNEDALAEMETYNKQDVFLLEDVYLKLRPWIKNHPNIGLFIDSNEPVCPACGSKNITFKEGNYYTTQVSRFPVFQCECGAVGRARRSVVTREKRKDLIVSVAR